jgi:hypothetical protein
MVANCNGCVHVHIKNGVVISIFAHLTNLPINGIVHLVPDTILSESEFIRTHPQDVDELQIGLNLGDNSIHLKDQC